MNNLAHKFILLVLQAFNDALGFFELLVALARRCAAASL